MKNFLLNVLFLFFIASTCYAQECQHVNMGDVFNSSSSENGPKISPDGKTMYFWRWRTMDEKSKDYGHEIWKSELGIDGKWEQAAKMGIPFNVGSYSGVESVGRNGNSLLLHGAYINGKYKGRGFSIISRQKDGWGKPQKLKIKDYEKMCRGKYSGATLSNDGTILILVFSEIENSVHNDMYVSFKESNGTWTKPKNMGTTVNSSFGEASTFISADGATLYFSSNREGGNGCYDIYMTTRKDNTWLNWSEPKNLGKSVNSNVCDIHFSIDAKEEYAYLGSVYNSQFGGEDIVMVKLVDSLKPRKQTDILSSDSVIVQNHSYDFNLLQQPIRSDTNLVQINKNSFLSSDFVKNNFNIYPNPTDVNFFLEITGTYKGQLVITIVDMKGNVISKEHIEQLDGIYTKRFDVSGFAKGFYIVTLTDGILMVSKKLLIK